MKLLRKASEFLVLSTGCCAALVVAVEAAECLAPTKQSNLQDVLACTSALCCPRDLDLQVNLVKAVAARLKSMGYSITDARTSAQESPEFTGMYKATVESPLRSAIRQLKKDKKIDEPGDEITYRVVNVALGVNLFDRWRAP